MIPYSDWVHSPAPCTETPHLDLYKVWGPTHGDKPRAGGIVSWSIHPLEHGYGEHPQ